LDIKEDENKNIKQNKEWALSQARKHGKFHGTRLTDWNKSKGLLDMPYEMVDDCIT